MKYTILIRVKDTIPISVKDTIPISVKDTIPISVKDTIPCSVKDTILSSVNNGWRVYNVAVKRKWQHRPTSVTPEQPTLTEDIMTHTS